MGRSGGIEQAARASAGQQRLWFLDRMAPGVYSHHEAFRVHGPLDLDRLRKALEALACRHAALRTTFRADGGGAAQVIADEPVNIELAVHDADDVASFLAAESGRPFDLSTGPLCRLSCGRLAADDHVVLLAIHHIISDGWSVGILLDELGQLYADAAAELPPLTTTFAEWSMREGEGQDEVLEWWERALAGAPPAIDLPLDHPRPPVQTFPARSGRVEITPATTGELSAWARRSGFTLFAAVAAAASVVLSRWSGQDDFVVGVPIAARDEPEVEGVIGFFVRTLLLRVDLAGQPTWDELLQRVRTSFLASLAHSAVPFETLVARVGAERDPALTPLFNVALALQDSPRAALQLEGLRVEPVEVPDPTVPFDLVIQVHPRAGGGLGVTVDANADLLDQPSVDRLARHLARAVEAAPRSAASPVSSLELFDPGELDRLVALTSTAPAPAPDAVWADFFAESVAAHQSNVAIDGGGRAVSYDELDRRSDEVADALSSKGIGVGNLVAVLLPRSVELIATLVGVLKVGAAFLPLDPADPEHRVGRILRDAGADLVLDAAISTGDAAFAARGRGGARPHDLAYVIYTSGSTGEPKGVQTLQQGLANLAAAQLRLLDVAPGDRILSWFAPTFDAFLFELNLALLTGATLVLAAPMDLQPGPPLSAALEREKVTVLCSTPSVLAVTSPPVAPQLRLVAACAEACPADVVEKWAAPGREILNCYGPTETSCCTNVGRCVPDGRRPNVGPPLAGVREYVIDHAGNLCPIGLPGELYIGGAAVGGGYRGLESLTAQRFVPDPLVPGGTAYRTGDRARLLPDGSIEILGRLDDQVKVRGHRVEPAEVASVLRSHPAVGELVVVPRSVSPSGPLELVAYVVPDSADGLEPRALREWARQRVPEYLVPAYVVLLERLPLLPSGKLDRRALPDPATTVEPDDWSPSTEAERDVAAAWAAVLGRSSVGPQGFFDAGGNSLLVVGLAEELERRLGVRFELAELFRWPTVSQQASVVELRRGNAVRDRVAVYEL